MIVNKLQIHRVHPNLRLALIIFACLGVILTTILHWSYLTRYPSVMIDEPWIANIAWTRLKTGVNFEAIHSGPLDQFGHEWSIRNYLGITPFVLSFALFGLGIFQARFVSLFFGLGLLMVVVIVGRKSYRIETGILAALFLSLSQPFLLSSHWARQDIMLSTFVMIALTFALLAFEKELWWAHFLAGLLLSLSMDIHENASLFFPGLAANYLVHYRREFLRKRGTWLVIAGGLLGVAFYLVYHVLPDPQTYLTLRSYETANVHVIPVQQLNLNILLSSLDDEIGRYHFYENNLDFALIGASLAYLTFRRNHSDRLLIIFIGLAFACFVLFQGSKYDYYAILFYPFFMLFVSETLVTMLFPLVANKGHQIFTLVLLMLFLVSSAIHLMRPLAQNRNYNYTSITNELRSVIPQGAHIMGSPTWWMGFSEFNYHSYKTLQYYQYFNHLTLVEGLEKVRPDILIIDPFLLSDLFDDVTSSGIQFNEPKFSHQEFDAFLASKGDLLTELHDPSHGAILVYAINWE